MSYWRSDGVGLWEWDDDEYCRAAERTPKMRCDMTLRLLRSVSRSADSRPPFAAWRSMLEVLVVQVAGPGRIRITEVDPKA